MRCHYCDREIGTARVCPYCHREIQKKTLPHQLPAGTLIDGRYRVEGVLGEGGFGITYLGYNQKLGMPVAIKEYFPQGTTYRDTSGSNEVYVGSEDAESFFEHGKERFLSEAKTLVRFNSEPGIVSVMDFVEENKTAYLIMEFLDGETLQQYLKRHGKMSATETFSMLEPMMRTLEKVHAAGVIHRDISPDNIMRLKNGQLKLMDFGAAREFVDENRSMSIMLKKGYAPAEQYRRKGEQGPWTDVYALCATIYRCITGVTPTDSLDRMSGEELKKPSELGADIPPAYEGLLMYGMTLHQKDRCQNMTELLSLLEKTQKAVVDQPTIPTKSEPATQVTVAADPGIKKPQKQKNEDPYVTVVAKEEPPIIKQDKKESLHHKDNFENEADQSKKKSHKGIIITVTVLVLIAVISVLAVVLIPQSKGDTKDNTKGNIKETTDNQTAEMVANGFKYRLLNDGTVEINGYAGKVRSMSIPSSIDGHTVTSIGYRSFIGSYDLFSVVIPDSVTSIEEEAFSDCSNLKTVSIPNSVTYIGEYAFYNCESLMRVTIPDSVTRIGEKSFGYKNGLETDGFTIYGAKGSAAEKYANNNSFFVFYEI